MIPFTWTEPFLSALSLTGNVSDAARRASIDRGTAYERRGKDEAFKAAWDDAIDQATEDLELEARRRAVGWEEAVSIGGVKVHSIYRHSDNLIMFLLKAHRPDVYRDNTKHEVTGKDGTPLVPTPTVDPSIVTHALGILASLGFRRPDPSPVGQPDDPVLSPSADSPPGGIPAAG